MAGVRQGAESGIEVTALRVSRRTDVWVRAMARKQASCRSAF